MPGQIYNMDTKGWPNDVGIHALEVYFPSVYVDQKELEIYDGVSEGKYTIGLGQSKMGFCSDREDINSLCLTVLQRLIERNGLSYNDIGRLEVGTETIIDKSKSVKTVLMQLFEQSGNSDVEGIDTTNACYGGTAALFNAVNWVESTSWDGRLAVVVAGDIAVYASGPARPTGGAGAVAMLVGPNAPLVLERGVRCTHMQHVYDFYKPDLSSEYPTVDGQLSIRCYLSALDKCYHKLREKAKHRLQLDEFSLDSASAFIFHSPFCKLVQKSFARLLLNDYLCDKDKTKPRYHGLQAFSNVKLAETYSDKNVEKAFMSASRCLYEEKTLPSLYVANQVGNMYTPSVYGGLASFIHKCGSAENLSGRRVVIFSYGSGLASSMFTLRFVDINQDTKSMRSQYSVNSTTGTIPGTGQNPQYSASTHNAFKQAQPSTQRDKLQALAASLSDLDSRLNGRVKASPEQFVQCMKLREETHHLAPYTPKASIDELSPGSWYVTHIDDMYRRSYDVIKPPMADGDTPHFSATTQNQPLSKSRSVETVTGGHKRAPESTKDDKLTSQSAGALSNGTSDLHGNKCVKRM